MITQQQKIGRNIITVEFEHMSELHKHNAAYGRLPKVCDNCKSDNIFPSYKNPKENDYWTIECGDCGASANFGILKNGKGLFWKFDAMEVYDPNKKEDKVDIDNSNSFPADTITNEKPVTF